MEKKKVSAFVSSKLMFSKYTIFFTFENGTNMKTNSTSLPVNKSEVRCLFVVVPGIGCAFVIGSINTMVSGMQVSCTLVKFQRRCTKFS